MEFRLPTIRVTKKFNFEMAHALTGHDGPCKNIHGHSYFLFITISGKPINDSTDPKNGMVMDFSDLKKIVHENIVQHFDHALVLNESDKTKIGLDEKANRIIYVPFAPTCEMLLGYFQHILLEKIPKHLKLHTIRLDETASSFADWHADDNL